MMTSHLITEHKTIVTAGASYISIFNNGDIHDRSFKKSNVYHSLSNIAVLYQCYTTEQMHERVTEYSYSMMQ